ncbi:hypothetical protein XENTR_v10005287 [Xenopus tropicalis]|nr:hypothetical protein XENTR_v10005287 [Xenopus tropicalis]
MPTCRYQGTGKSKCSVSYGPSLQEYNFLGILKSLKCWPTAENSDFYLTTSATMKNKIAFWIKGAKLTK